MEPWRVTGLICVSCNTSLTNSGETTNAVRRYCSESITAKIAKVAKGPISQCQPFNYEIKKYHPKCTYTKWWWKNVCVIHDWNSKVADVSHLKKWYYYGYKYWTPPGFFFGLMKRAKSTSRQTPGDFMVSFPPVTIGNGAKPKSMGEWLWIFQPR